MAISRGKVFLALHAILFALGGAVVAMLVSDTRGHPPAIVLAPVAIGFWLLGHGILWVSHKLVRTGAGPRAGQSSGRWPIAMLLLAFVFGGIFVVGSFGFLVELLFDTANSELRPFLIIAWLLPSLCFVGILLRRAWARFLSAAILAGAAVFLMYRMVLIVVYGNDQSVFVWLVGITILASLLYLAQHVLRSTQVKAFYA